MAELVRNRRLEWWTVAVRRGYAKRRLEAIEALHDVVSINTEL